MRLQVTSYNIAVLATSWKWDLRTWILPVRVSCFWLFNRMFNSSYHDRFM